jgi:hypothetical protein
MRFFLDARQLMTVKHLLVAGIAVAALGSAGAQSLKPGLWQITQQTQGGGDMGRSMAAMQKELANMPPEQRKMVEQHMARQGMQSAPGGGMAVKVCITPEMAQRNQVPGQHADCSSTSQARSGATMKYAFACTNPPSKGEGEVTFTSPEAYTSKMTVTTTVRGKPQQMAMQSSGHWLGAECGSVKPAVGPKR